MTIAVMQPYTFPHIGYFQMINAVDKFIFYDDVNYIKQGWINRNKILVSNKDYLFTIPLLKATSFSHINDTYLNDILYPMWKQKFLRTLQQSYKKAPYFAEVMPIVEEVFSKDYDNIADMAIVSTVIISEYLLIETEFITSSKTYFDVSDNRVNRLIEICKKEGADKYINAIGGQVLYKKENFCTHGIELNFIKSLPFEYKQFNDEFIPYLSIIDVLMFNSLEEVQQKLNNYTLIN